MDAVKKLILSNQDKMKYILLTGAILAGINCVSRPDFNFVSYLYIYYIWFSFNGEKVNKLKF